MKHAFSVAFVLVAMVFQFYVTPLLTIGGLAAPDFILITLFCLSYSYGILPVVGASLFLSLALDTTLSGGMFYTWLYLPLALCIGFLGWRQVRLGVMGSAGAVAAAVALKGLGMMFALPILHIVKDFSLVVFIANLPSALYTALLAVPICWGMDYIYGQYDNRERQRGPIYLK